MVESEAFFMNPKHKCHLSHWVKWAYGSQKWNEKRLLCESMFVPFDKRILILKIVESGAYFMKPKHQWHLCQWAEWAYGAQTWKESRLLCESTFVLIDKQTLILQKG